MMKNPDWDFWRHIPHAKVWQACALSLNIDPDLMKHSPHGWMNGIGSGPDFEPLSFPSRDVKVLFDKRLRLLAAHIGNPAHFRLHLIIMGNPARCEIYLTDFARWAVSEMEWGDMPPELVALAQKPDEPEQLEQAAMDGEPVTKTGRPPEIARKAEILDQIIQSMIRGKELNPNNLPGVAADLLDACQRIEDAKVGKKQIFSKSEDAFKSWLKAAGYGFKNGRAPSNEANYWTRLCVETMAKIDARIFTEVIPEKPL